MTSDEFKKWFTQHCSAFTGLGAWFAKLPRDSTKTGEASQAGVLRSWFGVLATTDLAYALEATGVMFRDDADVMFDRHPAVIRRIASQLSAPRRLAQRAKSWQTTDDRVRCPDCLDSGFRTVVRHNTVKDWLAGETGRFVYTCCVACPCPAGDDKFPDPPSKDGKPKRYPRFTAATMCLAEVKTPDGWRHATLTERREMLASWLDGYKQRQVERQYADNWEPTATYADVTGHDGF